MPISRPNAVVDFFVPDFESPSYIKGRIFRSKEPGINVGQGVLARAGGMQRILQIANGRRGHIFITADVSPNTNELSSGEAPWFASMVFDEANMVETQASFSVFGADGKVAAVIVPVDPAYSQVSATIQADGAINVVISPL